MLHKFSIRTLQVFACFCLFLFLGQKLAVPILHEHHSTAHSIHGNLDVTGNGCFACDVAHAASLFEVAITPAYAFYIICFGSLFAVALAQRVFRTVLFSSLRAPPLS